MTKMSQQGSLTPGLAFEGAVRSKLWTLNHSGSQSVLSRQDMDKMDKMSLTKAMGIKFLPQIRWEPNGQDKIVKHRVWQDKIWGCGAE